jgi:hypothetical protein
MSEETKNDWTGFTNDVIGSTYAGMGRLARAHWLLSSAIQHRISGDFLSNSNLSKITFPVGLCFVRGDRAGDGKSIAEQVVASFAYWNRDSSKYFDIIFPGWQPSEATIHFDLNSFLTFREDLESACKWRYSGETDLLLLNYDYVISELAGSFRFDEVIYIPVEAMLKDGRIRSLDALMAEIVRHAKETWPRSDRAAIWQISDRIGIERGNRSLWDFIRKLLLRDASKIYDQLRPFVVCDLRIV